MDQEASSPYGQEPGMASDLGGFEFVVEEEIGLAEGDEISDLEDDSSEESFVSFHEDGEIDPEECLDGLALNFGAEISTPADLAPLRGWKML